jgi:hypothetical protein
MEDCAPEWCGGVSGVQYGRLHLTLEEYGYKGDNYVKLP